MTPSPCSIFFFNRFVVHDIFFLDFFCARIFFWLLPNPPLKYLMVRPLGLRLFLNVCVRKLKIFFVNPHFRKYFSDPYSFAFLEFLSNKPHACFIRRILVASNAIKTIDNEMINRSNNNVHYLLFHYLL